MVFRGMSRGNFEDCNFVKVGKRLEAKQVSFVFRGFENKSYPRLFSGFIGIVEGLANGLSPFWGKIKFYSVGIGETVNAGTVVKGVFKNPFMIGTPFLLVFFFRVNMGGECKVTKGK